jgi:hypothetical protein
MKTISYRVTPVTRWNLTLREDDPERGAGSCGSVGEFASSDAAEQVGRALAAQTPGTKFTPMDGETEVTPYQQWVAVERGFKCATNVVYCHGREAAETFAALAQADHQREFRLFSRQVTDPVAAAHVGVGGGFTVPSMPDPIED